MICIGCKKEIDRKFKFSGFPKDNFDYPCESNFNPEMLPCTARQASDYILSNIQPERSKREDLECVHKNDLKEYRDKNGYCFDPMCKTCKDAVL